MLFPFGVPTHLQKLPAPKEREDSEKEENAADRNVLCVSCNRERMLFASLTKRNLSIYWSNPQVLLINYERSETSCSTHGYNSKLVWKPDSSAVAVSTSTDYLLFYKVDFDARTCLYQIKDLESSKTRNRSANLELFVKDPVPTVKLIPGAVVHLSSLCSCMVSLKEEISIVLTNGWLHRLMWNGDVLDEFSTPLLNVPFFNDQLQSKPEYLKNTPNVYVSSFAYSPLIGGYGIVLSNGRAALLTSLSPRFHPSELRAVWAPGMVDGVCCTINHKYRLFTIGCKNSDVASYHLDETSGALVLTYRVQAKVMENPEVVQSLGAVLHLEWSPFCCTLAVSWSNGCMAGFSVFGSQLWFLRTDSFLSGYQPTVMTSSSSAASRVENHVTTFDWGPEGFQLWFGCQSELLICKYGRAVNLNNFSTVQNERLAIVCSEEILLSLPRAPETQMNALAQSYWQRIQVPWNYMGYAWPLRFCSLNSENQTLCIAGSRGFAFYNLYSGKWRLFGNETQEREVLVTCSPCFWNDFLIASCFDISQQSDELRFYPQQCNLDNQFCSTVKLEAQVLYTNLRNSVLLTFDIDSKCTLFALKIDTGSHNFPKVQADKCAEILVSDLIGHPACMISAHLMFRSAEEDLATFCDDVDTILLNISGRLIMLSPQNLERKQAGKDSLSNHLEPPMLVASFVENVWINTQPTSSQPHLTHALWICCGARGMRVWMPLFPKEQPGDQKNRSFISKRIMLPFELSSIYPIVVASSECLVVGIEAYCTENDHIARVHRKSEVFLHYILRQLLKRNLGLYALEIARTSESLPYFSHVLELLLHSVLEEEATSSEAIPDPLLPRVVAFLQEFPEFLQTVAHCARKTEMALWKHLFQTVGNPKDLFDVCIREKQLETAASYFIILQNMESSVTTKQQATQLLEACLDNRKWMIARDIVRLLKSVDPDDFESPPTTPLVLKQTAAAHRVPTIGIAPNVEDADSFIFQRMAIAANNPRQRQPSISNTSPNDSSGVGVANFDKLTKAIPVQPQKKTSLAKAPSLEQQHLGQLQKTTSFGENDLPVDIYLSLILSRHARDLLASGHLYDLGCFAAHLEFHLVLWLGKEKNRSARVQDFPQSLHFLHKDFQWPYPLLSYTLMEHFNKKIQLSPMKETVLSLTKPLHVITRNGSTDSGMPKSIGQKLQRPSLQLKHLESNNLASTFSTKDTKMLLIKQQQRDLSLPSPETQTIPLQNKLEMQSSVAGASEMTEESWLGADAETTSQLDLDWDCLEQLCGETVARGPPEREVQLRFLQQIMLESNCLEWSVLICLVLRDIVGLARAVNAGSVARAPSDTIQRLLHGMSELDSWADNFCLGYKPLFHAVQSHLELLNNSTLDSALSISKPNAVEEAKESESRVANSTNGTTTAEQQQQSDTAITTNSNNNLSSKNVKMSKSAKPPHHQQQQKSSSKNVQPSPVWAEYNNNHRFSADFDNEHCVVSASSPQESQCSVM